MPRTLACSAAIVLLTAVAAAQSSQPCQPPALAPGSRPNIFSEEQEMDLGDAIAEHIQREFRVIDDEEVTAYLSEIGERIIKRLPPTRLRFRFMLVDIPTANAFTLPGGRIYISRKLVALAKSEDELAGVMAHEIGHQIARQGAADMTRLLREVLGVNQVGDRRDIFDKYNQLIENHARKPKAFTHGEDPEKEQLVADQLGLLATAAAGYDPQAFARFWDRFAETGGKTGSFLSNLFGTTKPEEKRLREMMKAAAGLPASCLARRAATSPDAFSDWQASVMNYTGLGRREVLHGMRSKVALNPPLRGNITHIRFSPDGKYVLAQDDGGINVLTREPFAPLFRIDAPEAREAHFTPDSQYLAFYSPDLRVEIWSVADQARKTVHEVFTGQKGCIQTALSPDGKTLACLNSEMDLALYEAASSKQLFVKKKFYTPDAFMLLIRLLGAVLADEPSDVEADWINMHFSPDGRYFVAGARSSYINAIGGFGVETSAAIVDLNTLEPVPARGELKRFLSGGFAFLGPDRVLGLDPRDAKKSAVVSFPGGAVLEAVPLERGKLSAPTRGNYVMIRPAAQYPVGVMDLSKKSFFLGNKEPALDLYDELFVAERRNGELGLYNVGKNDVQATVRLPRNPLGRLRAAALSADHNWLAVSERTRGGVWNLAKGERFFHVRGFRGAFFSDDGALYADFPKFETTERALARLDPTRREAAVASKLEEDWTVQYGPYVLVTKPAKKDGSHMRDVTFEMHDAKTMALLWFKPFPKEAPRVWIRDGAMVLSWGLSAEAAKAEIKNDPRLAQQLAAMKEKEGDYFLKVLDARTGEDRARLLIETGKGSFRITDAFATGDWVVISDNANRVLVYSLATGEAKLRVFGGRAAASAASNLMCVENEPGQLTVYDLVSMERRDEFTFSSPVAMHSFSPDGKRLFVLTKSQMVYSLEVSSGSRTRS